MRLTVIVPVWNQEVLVKRALESIPSSCEIIVIDDGSTDGTMATILDFTKDQPDTIVLSNANNEGVSYTLNKGLDAATGDYVVLLGSDDYFYTGAFERVMEQMDGTDLIYFNLQIDNGKIYRLKDVNKQVWCGSVKLMRREFIGDTRNQQSRISGEDYFFFQELLAKTPTEKFTNITCKHYSFPREGSLSNLYKPIIS